MASNPKTQSELLVEEYFGQHNHSDWEPVPVAPEKTPDYRLRFESTDNFLEVKEFDGPMPQSGYGRVDAYGSLRRKIKKAATKFKNYRDSPCSIVLANPKQAFILLSDWQIVMGAMLGDVGVRFPVGPGAKNDPSSFENVFTTGGAMIDPAGKPQHKTVSSLIVLGVYEKQLNEVRVKRKKLEAREARSITTEEMYSLFQETPKDEPLRAVVYENPFAAIPLNRNLFCGPYDKRYGPIDGRIGRVFTGQRALEFEELLGSDARP
jgi:hypothetical protein